MAKLTKRCRVCGKEYEACKSLKTGSSTFNWREVACSPECGMEYLRMINESRGLAVQSEPMPAPARPARSKSKKVEEPETIEADTSVFTVPGSDTEGFEAPAEFAEE